MASNEIDYNSEQYRRFFYNAEEFENFKKFLNGYNELKNIDRSPKQTCLEKRGFTERKRLLGETLGAGGYGKGNGIEYSDRHKNAISERNKIKGKGSQSGGHTYFQPYFGKPHETKNRIVYNNFITLPDDTTSIGGKIDIDKREESILTKRYNVKNEYSSKNQDALSDGNIHGKGTGFDLDTQNGGGGYDVASRTESLLQNKWLKDDPYTKMLVSEEYLIQTEFPIETTDATVEEQGEEARYREKYGDDWKKVMKEEKKKRKTAAKEAIETLKEEQNTINARIKTNEKKAKAQRKKERAHNKLIEENIKLMRKQDEALARAMKNQAKSTK
jgi:hypothetical protein